METDAAYIFRVKAVRVSMEGSEGSWGRGRSRNCVGTNRSDDTPSTPTNLTVSVHITDHCNIRIVTSSSLQDEHRVEMNSRRVTELESVHNNVRLLSDMLDQYQLGQTSAEELELIKELHQSCERLRPSVFRLASETQDNDSVLSEYMNTLLQLLNGNMFKRILMMSLTRKRLFLMSFFLTLITPS